MPEKIERKRCFNCKQSGSMSRPLFCDDCLRMALICLLAGGSGGELIHRILDPLF